MPFAEQIARQQWFTYCWGVLHFTGVALSTNKFISSIKWVLGTIFLGALGSGLWELFISDLFIWLGLTSLELATNIFTGFKDTLYEEVSDGAVVSFLKLPAQLIAFALVILPTVLLIKIIVNYVLDSFDEYEGDEKPESSENPKVTRKTLTYRKVLISLMSIIVVSYLFMAFQYLYTAKAAKFVEKSVDILSPHISENKRLTLIAEYRTIKNSEDYESIYSKLRNLEKEHDVELPEFEPI